MARRKKLDSISAEEVVRIVHEIGQAGAAAHFHVSSASISRKLKSGGFVPHIQYIRIEDIKVVTPETASEGQS